jgi:hypothetical protein
LEDSDSEEENITIEYEDPDSDDDSIDDNNDYDFWYQVMARASPDALAVERKRLEEALVVEKALLKEAEKQKRMAGLMEQAGWRVVKGEKKSEKKIRNYKEHTITYYETAKLVTVEEWPQLPKTMSPEFTPPDLLPKTMFPEFPLLIFHNEYLQNLSLIRSRFSGPSSQKV